MFKRIDHVALHVVDVGAAAAFYVDTFGFEKVFSHRGGLGQEICYVRLADTLMEITTRPGGEPMSGFHICLEPDDFEAAYAVLRARDLPLVVDVRPTTPRGPSEAGWRRAMFRGPHGELIEIRGGAAA